MSLNAALLPEFDHEFAGTRRTLERVPFEKAEWRPHPKSWTLIQLATHLTHVPAWMAPTLTQESVDLATFDPETWRRLPGSHAELMKWFDDALAAARGALANASDAALLANWSLRTGEKVHMTMPRIAAVRGYILNHNVHHRAQLGVYLRLLDVPVPALYGPSADEQGMM
jgi:uncharacterized damage-inducible protein DinB